MIILQKKSNNVARRHLYFSRGEGVLCLGDAIIAQGTIRTYALCVDARGRLGTGMYEGKSCRKQCIDFEQHEEDANIR